MTVPTHITAGDSVSWVEPGFTSRSGQFIDPAGWGLSLALRGAGAGLNIVGASDGSGWTFALTKAQTAALNTTPVTLLWSWQLVAELANERLTAATGVLRVRPNLAGLPVDQAFDGRSDAAKTLAAIEAEISARVNGGATLEYSIGQRSLKKETMAALMQLRTQYRAIVRRERLAGSGGSDLQLTGISFR